MAEFKQPQVVANADISFKTDPNRMKSQDITTNTPAMRVSVGDPGNDRINTNRETKVRGCGAAIKGITARGPMA